MNEVQKELYDSKCNLVCGCGCKDLTVHLGFDGITTHGYDLYLLCEDCGTVNSIARLKTDSSDTIEYKEKPNLGLYIEGE
jgi:uncharacterized Zn finger protein